MGVSVEDFYALPFSFHGALTPSRALRSWFLPHFSCSPFPRGCLSCACAAHVVVPSGAEPHAATSDTDLLRLIAAGKGLPVPLLPSGCDARVQALAAACLDAEPSRRPAFGDVVHTLAVRTMTREEDR